MQPSDMQIELRPRDTDSDARSTRSTRTPHEESEHSPGTSTAMVSGPATGERVFTAQGQRTENHRKYQIITVIAGFFMIFNVFGINTSFGIFQEYYTSDQSHLKDSQNQDALVSLIGSIGSGLTWSGGILVGPLMRRVDHVQWITASGVVIMSLGLLLTSFAERVWHVFLTQALLFGMGSSLCYFPIISITPLYFDRNRGLAMGIVLSGLGIGGLVYAPVLRLLIDRVGAPWTFRIMTLWNLAIGLPISFAVKFRPGFKPTGRTRLTWDLVRRGTFISQALSAFFQAAGNLVPLYYLTSYSISVLSYSKSFASILLALNNVTNSIARISMGYVADRVGRQNTMVISVLLSGVSVFALWYDASRARFIVFVVMYGVLAGGYNALFPTAIAEIYGVQHYASVNGSIYFIRGLGSMFGAPIAGLILGSYSRSGPHSGMGGSGFNGTSPSDGLELVEKRYKDIVIYDGVLLLCASLSIACVRWYDAKEKGWTWKA